MPYTSKGYEYKKIHGHPLANKSGCVMVHRLVWYEVNGPIPKDRIIHHKNGDIKDNRLENLELHTRSSHAREHWADSGLNGAGTNAEMADAVCVVCGATFTTKAWKIREGIRKGRKFCCSNTCATEFARSRRWPRALAESTEP